MKKKEESAVYWLLFFSVKYKARSFTEIAGLLDNVKSHT